MNIEAASLSSPIGIGTLAVNRLLEKLVGSISFENNIGLTPFEIPILNAGLTDSGKFEIERLALPKKKGVGGNNSGKLDKVILLSLKIPEYVSKRYN